MGMDRGKIEVGGCRTVGRSWTLLLAVVALTSCTPGERPPAPAASPPPGSVLLFSETAGFRHSSIEAGVQALTALAEAEEASGKLSRGRTSAARRLPPLSGSGRPPACPSPASPLASLAGGSRHASLVAHRAIFPEASEGLPVVHTEDSSVFAAEGLEGVGVVVFLSTTGDVLTEGEQSALRAWYEAGGGWLGVHAAADTEYDWPWYGAGLLGVWFQSHPPTQEATVRVVAAHPATEGLPESWVPLDEWYDFRSLPPPDAVVVLEVDEATYRGGAMGAPHPIAWARTGGGRMFYTAMGHPSEAFEGPLFLAHPGGALRWVAGLVD